MSESEILEEQEAVEETVQRESEEEAEAVEEKIEETALNDLEIFLLKSEIWENALLGAIDIKSLREKLAPVTRTKPKAKPKTRVAKKTKSRKKRKQKSK